MPTTKKSQIISLLENALSETLLSQNDGFIDSKVYNSLNKQEVPQKIREQMHYLKDKSPIEYSEIEDRDINTELSNSEILNEYIKKNSMTS